MVANFGRLDHAELLAEPTPERPPTCAPVGERRYSVKKRSIGSAMLAIVVSLALAGTVLGAAFDNGSFENGTFTPYSAQYDFDRLSAGSTDLSNWTITTGSIDWIRDYWQAAAGYKSLDLDGDEGTPGAISQVIDTSVNGTYFVMFAMSGNPDQQATQPTNKTMTIDVGGAPTSFAYDVSTAGNTLTNMKWVSKSYVFVATGASTTLTFTSTTPGGYGPALDNVVITQVLPGGALCKGGNWVNLVDSTGASFRNQGDCVSYFATGERNLAY